MDNYQQFGIQPAYLVQGTKYRKIGSQFFAVSTIQQ
jgi:hypothetical protein